MSTDAPVAPALAAAPHPLLTLLGDASAACDGDSCSLPSP